MPEETLERKIELIKILFKDVSSLRFLELMRNHRERGDTFMCNHARIIAMTATHAALKRDKFIALNFSFDTFVSEE